MSNWKELIKEKLAKSKNKVVKIDLEKEKVWSLDNFQPK